jgi:N-methylhydantoinase A
MVAHAVYDRYLLSAGDSLIGPAIIEERESTIIIGAGGKAAVDDYGTLRIDTDLTK